MFRGNLSNIQKLIVTDQQTGFTLLESLIALGIVGILTVATAPGWLTFLEKWRLTDAQANLHAAIQQTQTRAQNNSINWQLSIRETSEGIVEWAMHPQTDIPRVWESLGDKSVDIDIANTTLDKRSGIYYIRFNYKGHLASRTRTLTFTSSKVSRYKRCIVMSTILGATRKGTEQDRPSSSGRDCY